MTMRSFSINCACCVMLMFACAGHVAGQAEPSKVATDDAHTYWIFLTAGKSTDGVERSTIGDMQSAHLENFRRLHAKSQLLTAGPLADPERKLRGIVVVKASDSMSLAKMFESDPYVTQGYLLIDATPVQIAVGEFQRDVDPQAMAEYRLVMLDQAANDTDELNERSVAQNLAYCHSIHDTKRLCFAGWFSDNKSSRRGVLIFHKLEDAAIRGLVDELPAVKSEQWKARIMPLYMNEGIVR